MAKLNNLTAVILTKNEEKKLPQCLKSLSFVDRIIVIDDGSTDGTVALAEKYGAQIWQRRLDDFSSQRNFALDQVKTEWVLFIDADEEVSLPLAQEISRAIEEKEFAGYRIARKNFIFGHFVKHSGWYPDYQLHLFKSKKGSYQEKVHEQVEVKGKIGQLKNDLIHHNYGTISDFLSQLQFDLYTGLEAQQLVTSGYRFDWSDLLKKPADEFLRRFFAEKGYQDGILGLILAIFQAFKEFVIYAKVWEIQGKQEIKNGNLYFLKNLESGIREKLKEISYWFLSSQIDEEKNPFKKRFLKLKRKIFSK